MPLLIGLYRKLQFFEELETATKLSLSDYLNTHKRILTVIIVINLHSLVAWHTHGKLSNIDQEHGAPRPPPSSLSSTVVQG